MTRKAAAIAGALLLAFQIAFAPPVRAIGDDTLESVVSVLPVWPGKEQGGFTARPGTAPEGSGVVLSPGIIATAWHVVEPAERIDIRLSDGRVFPARLIAGDPGSDIAILGADVELTPFEIAPGLDLAQPVCAIGNVYGLGLSVTCGVVSALNVTDAGFNPVEDFVQTDAAANPGVSGGALVDMQGRLAGMMSAIFASQGETNIGVNFAVSTGFLLRVAEALAEDGEVRYPSPGWRLGRAPRDELARAAAPVVEEVEEGSPAEMAGIRAGDMVLVVGPRRTRTPRDATTALAVAGGEPGHVGITLLRGGRELAVALAFDGAPVEQRPRLASLPGDCPHPQPVCLARQAVFPVSGFDPIASATRIGPSLLVTNRHVVADWPEATVHTPNGPRGARVVASAYTGDLALLEVEGLPEDGFVPGIDGGVPSDGVFYAIGADIARQEIRVFDPGKLISGPARDAELGRLHVSSRMQPGVSGGALVDEHGELVGIAVGGGDGRFEAIPLEGVRALLALREDPAAAVVASRLGRAVSDCSAEMDAHVAGAGGEAKNRSLATVCASSMNHGQLLEAGRILARGGDFGGAVALHLQAAEQVPNSINARISLLVSLQLSGRFEEMTGHARWLMRMAPDDPQALRFAIQSGVWGNAPELAEEAYEALLDADPKQAAAARRFIDNSPPPPARR